MKSKTKAIKVFLGEEQGPTTVEYAIMLAMIIGICIVAVVYLASSTGESFDTSSGAISGAISN
jgi:pilus assembly protein Flp/PilA